jgi:signal transduction histidine kinase/ActR/RegA family two-component response regulator
VPLVGHGGRNLGVVQLSDKYEGEFTEQDETVLVQLAAIAVGGIENARLYEQLREQDRRKDEFLATLAHELRNPLAPIRTGLAVLDMSPSPQAAAQTREVMARQVTHMARLIDDLLDISRITRGQVQLRGRTVELKSIIDAALEVSRPLIEANRHGLFVSRPPEPLLLHVDPTRIAQVISNLLNNAAKYTPEGGRIELSAEREGDTAVIRVRDSGVGLPADALDEVFELFTQVGNGPERGQGGLGIGLALVKRLVRMHGGTVRAESPGPGQGSTFSVCLPLAAESLAAAPSAPEAAAAPAPLARRRILAVDDNIDAVDTLATLLRLLGHEVQTAHTGSEGVAAAHAFRPELVFLDIGLPGMNGYEVIERLRTDPATAGLVIVALTGWGNDDDRRRTHEAGFDHHLTKPVDREQLEQLLGEIEQRQQRPA